jgi:hypothetical protein
MRVTQSSYEDPPYVIISIVLLLSLSWAHVFFLALCSQNVQHVPFFISNWNMFLCSRLVLGGRRTACEGSVPRVQQADPTRAEHDTESGCSIRSRLRSTHQCGKRLNHGKTLHMRTPAITRYPELRSLIQFTFLLSVPHTLFNIIRTSTLIIF